MTCSKLYLVASSAIFLLTPSVVHAGNDFMVCRSSRRNCIDSGKECSRCVGVCGEDVSGILWGGFSRMASRWKEQCSGAMTSVRMYEECKTGMVKSCDSAISMLPVYFNRKYNNPSKVGSEAWRMFTECQAAKDEAESVPVMEEPVTSLASYPPPPTLFNSPTLPPFPSTSSLYDTMPPAYPYSPYQDPNSNMYNAAADYSSMVSPSGIMAAANPYSRFTVDPNSFSSASPYPTPMMDTANLYSPSTNDPALAYDPSLMSPTALPPSQYDTGAYVSPQLAAEGTAGAGAAAAGEEGAAAQAASAQEGAAAGAAAAEEGSAAAAAEAEAGAAAQEGAAEQEAAAAEEGEAS